MNGPTRWRDRSDAAPDGVRALLDVARAPQPMSSNERALMAKRVARIALTPAAVGLLVSLKGVAFAAAIGAGCGVVVAGGITIVEMLTDDAPAPSIAPPRSVSPVQNATTASILPGGIGTAPAASLSTAVDPAKGVGGEAGVRLSRSDRSIGGEMSVPASTNSTSALQAPTASQDPSAATPPSEASLIEDARKLVGSRPVEALARLQLHKQMFPSGRLSTEREFIAIAALRHLGRTAEAKARGDALLPYVKGGVYEARLRGMLQDLQ